MNIDTKQYGKLHLQVGRTVKPFQTCGPLKFFLSSQPLVLRFTHLMCLGPEQKQAQIILVCFLGAMVTMIDRIQCGEVPETRWKCSNQISKTGNRMQY